MDRYVTFVDRVASNPNCYTRTVNSNGTVSLTLNDSPSKTGTQINASLVNGLQDHFYNQYLTDKNSLVETFTSFGYSATTDTTFAQFIEWAKEISYFTVNGVPERLDSEDLDLVPVELSYAPPANNVSIACTYAECETLDGQTAYIWGGSDLKSEGTYMYQYDSNDETYTKLSAGSTISSYCHTYKYAPHSCVVNGKIIYVYGTRIFSFDGSTWTVLKATWGSSCVNYGGVCKCDVNNRIYIAETSSTGVLSTYFQIYAVDLDDFTATDCTFAQTNSTAESIPMVVVDGILYWINEEYYLKSYDIDTDTTTSIAYNSSRHSNYGRFYKIWKTWHYVYGNNWYTFDITDGVGNSIATKTTSYTPTGYVISPICVLNGKLYNFDPYSNAYYAPYTCAMKYQLKR